MYRGGVPFFRNSIEIFSFLGQYSVNFNAVDACVCTPLMVSSARCDLVDETANAVGIQAQ